MMFGPNSSGLQPEAKDLQLSQNPLHKAMESLYLDGTGAPNRRAPSSRKGSEFPYFWRRTLSNPITSHKAQTSGSKRKRSYELIQPSKLKLIPGAYGSVRGKPASFGLGYSSLPHSVPGLVSPSSSNESLSPRGSAGVIPGLDFNSLSIGSGHGRGSGAGLLRAPILSLPIGTLVQRRSRPWKSRASKSKAICSLPAPTTPLAPIVEEEEEEPLLSPSLSCLNLSPPLQQGPPANINGNALSSCSQQALMETGGCDDVTIDELASYLDLMVHIPKKMSPMAEMMYT